MKSLVLLAVTATLALTACTSGSQRDAGEVVSYQPAKRVVAPAVAGELITGGSFDLADQKGKVVVINFWASWCAPCRVEADDLEAVFHELSGVEFLGINIRDEKDKAVSFHEGRTSYPSIFDPAGRIALAFKQVPPNTIPATLVIDAQGRIAVVIRKAIHRDELKPLVSAIAAEGTS
jgi:thiol-disulfide isomerase/thioredoxin